MLQLLLVSLALTVADKPTISLEDSCRAARAIAVVEPSANLGEYRLIEVLFASPGHDLKKDAVIAVDLKGMVYDKGQAYILFLDNAEKGKGFRAVMQRRTEDAKATRERVMEVLRNSGKVK
jgi:uncharacterized protein YrzB (UPF0473 family)